MARKKRVEKQNNKHSRDAPANMVPKIRQNGKSRCEVQTSIAWGEISSPVLDARLEGDLGHGRKGLCDPPPFHDQLRLE